MVVRKTFRYRLYPTTGQAARLRSWQHALRFLWNLALEQRLWGLDRPRCQRRYYTAFDQINQLAELRTVLPWLADVPRNVCAQLLVELDKAWQRCFAKLAQRPRWKRKGVDHIPLCEPHPKVWGLGDAGLHFPKLDHIRIILHRQIEGTPKTCALVEESGQWFAAISCVVEVPDPVPRTVPVVALDRGVVNLVADSDGRIVPNPRHLEATMNRLRRAQRTVSRRKKGSANREKAKLRVAKLHRKIRRQRNHVLHVLSATYAKSHGTVVVESLRTKDMIQVGGGLARSIGSAGWATLVAFLRYKLEWSGGRLVEVPAAYSSQTCSSCGAVDAKSRRSQAEFVCVVCRYVDHADLNAAKVLKSRANRAALPVEGSPPEGSRRSRKRLRVPKMRSSKSLVL